jgi:hypothetical protein
VREREKVCVRERVSDGIGGGADPASSVTTDLDFRIKMSSALLWRVTGDSTFVVSLL